jgi:hypothetical protein
MKVLTAEEEKARKLVRSFNSPQRKMAILSENHPVKFFPDRTTL